MEISKVVTLETSCGEFVGNQRSDYDKFSLASAECSWEVTKPKRYSVSWGIGIRASIIAWFVVFVIPLSLIVLCFEAEDVPQSIVGLFAAMISVAVFGVFVLTFATPSAIARDSEQNFTLYISPIMIPLIRFGICDVSEVRKIEWPELLCMKAVGYPTDWQRSVCIELKSGRKILLSPKDPDMFISYPSVKIFSPFRSLLTLVCMLAREYWSGFCGGEDSFDDCVVETLGLLLPYYVFLFIFLPVRVYEVRLLPPSYPPRWWPLSHTVKRLTCVGITVSLLLVISNCILQSSIKPYMVFSVFVRVACWGSSYWILAMEYKRYQPLTWVGLRGFWFLTGIEGTLRVTWASTYGQTAAWVTVLTCVLQIWMALVAVWVPTDLNVNLLSHIQRLLLEHPSATDEEVSLSNAVYTLHEDENASSSRSNARDAYQSKRADTPGWIYSVEEELPFRPKIDVIDVHVVAINKDRHIKTVYRVHTRVTTDSDPPMVVEFNAKRRYKELRWLDDRLRTCFDHSSFPEQRASMGSFPPREITQADPFARQVAFREYLRRLSQSPFFYSHEFLDMVGIDARFDAGRLYECCLSIQCSEQSKVPNRHRRPPTPIGAKTEVMPWRPPMLLSSSGTGSPLVSISATPPPEVSMANQLSVSIPDFFTSKRVVYYRIVLMTHVGVFESKHRFSDFQRLSVHLRDFLEVRPSVSLPRLVRLPGMFASPEEFLEDRRTKLELYLQCIVGDFASVVASSRFLRTFFKLPTDSAVIPGIPASSHDSPSHTDDERITPTSGTIGRSNLLEDVGGSPGEESCHHDDQSVAVSIPFFHYDLSSEDAPLVRYCCRFRDGMGNEWTRFHEFEDFQKLRSDLNQRHAYLIDSVPDFPASHSLWTLSSQTDAKLEIEGRRRVLSKWLAHVVSETLNQRQQIEDVEPLWRFVQHRDDL